LGLCVLILGDLKEGYTAIMQEILFEGFPACCGDSQGHSCSVYRILSNGYAP
jgi:hypothetical protein